MKVLKGVIFIVITIFAFGCGQGEKPKSIPPQQVESGESFTTFFTKFNRDSIFQKSRVVFPFKLMQSDGEADTTIYIPRNNWHYVDFSFPNDRKNIITQERVNDNEMKVLLQVEDTGVYLEHLFQRKNGQWQLVYVKNSSD